MSLKEILEKIQEDVVEREQIRDIVQRDMRKATRLSKQAIQFTHLERFDDAKANLEEARLIFNRLRETGRKHPYLFYSGSVGAGFEENAEAQILLTLVLEGRFPTPKEIDVPGIPYVLSLGDVIGELRRRSLNLIRKGKIKVAEECLEWMEHIYLELIALDDAYIIINGLRKKGDIARRLIEITRGDITIEVGKSNLEHSISKLEKSLKKKLNK